MKSKITTVVTTFLSITFTLCSIISPTFSIVEASDGKIPIFVTILPQKFFVEQIGKQRVDVQVMVEPAANPHTYEPKPQQMTALSKTQIYFAIGLPFEKVWLRKILDSNKSIKVVHTDKGIKKIQMASHHHHEEESKHNINDNPPKGGDHNENENLHSDNHGEPDPHIWLSPKLVTIQAKHILDGLKEIDPKYADLYEANYKEFISEVSKLDSELNAIFSDKQKVQFIVFHPSWGYFAQNYNLKEIPIEIEGKNPKPAQLQKIIHYAREEKISVIFVQPQFSVKNAQLIAKEIDGEVLFVDPLAYNWFKNLREVAKKFKNTLK